MLKIVGLLITIHLHKKTMPAVLKNAVQSLYREQQAIPILDSLSDDGRSGMSRNMMDDISARFPILH
jgi:hypothetical protein